MCKESKLGLESLKRNIHGAPYGVKVTVFKSTVGPTFDYAALAGNCHLVKTSIKLEKAQHEAACFTFNDYGHYSSVKDGLNSLKWPLL